MNKYLVGFMAFGLLPVSAFAELVSRQVYPQYQPSAVVITINKETANKPVVERKVEKPVRRHERHERYEPRQHEPEPVKVVYRDRNKKANTGSGYMGLRADLSFLSWENKYRNQTDSGSDKFKFKPVFGLDLSVGYKVNDNWRIDGEFGYVGKYSETATDYFPLAEKTEFSLETYYIDANAYYNIAYGFYVGFGGGLAITHVFADHSDVPSVSASNFSPMGAAMLGWTRMLDEKIALDIRYRFAAYDGGKFTIGEADVDTGTVMNHTASIGLRYHF